jgi:hypothetical protein
MNFRRLKYPLIFVIFLCGFTLTVSAQQPPAPAPTSSPMQWREFESKDGAFSVQLPGVAKIGNVPFTKGPVTFMRYTHQVLVDGYFMEVDYWDLPTDGSDSDLSAEGAISGMIRALEAKGGRLVTRQNIAASSCQGREAVMAIPGPAGQKEGVAIGRVFSSRYRFYTLVFISPGDDQKSRLVSETFLNSFRLKVGCTSGVAPVTATVAPTKTIISGTTDPSGWRRIESSQQGFSVLMPGEAQLEVEAAQTKPFLITHYTYGLSRADSLFSVEVLGEYPTNFHPGPESLKTLLDVTVYAMKRNLEPAGFVVVPLRDLKLGQTSGQEFGLAFEKTKGKGRAQVFVTAKRVYIAIAIENGSNATLSNVDRFFSSLTLNPD